MRHLFMCCALWLTAFGAHAQISPVVFAEAQSEFLLLDSLTLSDTETQVHLQLSCYAGLTYHLAEPQQKGAFYLQAGEQKLALQKIEGASGAITCEEMGLLAFTLYFPPLPDSTRSFTLSDGETTFRDILPLPLEEAAAQAKKEHPKYLYFLGKFYLQEYNYTKAEQFFAAYVSHVMKHHGEQSIEYLKAINTLVQLYISTVNYTEAEALCRQTLDAFGEEKPETASLWATLGDILQVQSKHNEALAAYQTHLQHKAKVAPLKGSEYSMVANLMNYSYSSLPSGTLPLAIGLAAHPGKLREGWAYLKIFSAGAAEMRLSTAEDFEGAAWEKAETQLKRELAPDAPWLYFQVRDAQQQESTVFKLDLNAVRAR